MSLDSSSDKPVMSAVGRLTETWLKEKKQFYTLMERAPKAFLQPTIGFGLLRPW